MEHPMSLSFGRFAPHEITHGTADSAVLETYGSLWNSRWHRPWDVQHPPGYITDGTLSIGCAVKNTTAMTPPTERSYSHWDLLWHCPRDVQTPIEQNMALSMGRLTCRGIAYGLSHRAFHGRYKSHNTLVTPLMGRPMAPLTGHLASHGIAHGKFASQWDRPWSWDVYISHDQAKPPTGLSTDD